MPFCESYGSIIRPHVYTCTCNYFNYYHFSKFCIVTPPVSRRNMLVIDSKNRTQSDARDRTIVKPRGTDKVSPNSSPSHSSPEVQYMYMYTHVKKIMYNREIKVTCIFANLHKVLIHVCTYIVHVHVHFPSQT